ncbi:uncharacterized protein LOC127090291 [Lathyrus oleraceus]|uniref:uncharacterized protein LOC127090291 n=1 Tax=Pisum sativum TaxID=3888 RepID=UPI0021D1301B|nr:uncharacterized protein LOC127090291 [Pisum sativum]
MAPPKSSSSKNSKKAQDLTLHPAHDLKGPMTIGNQQYVPEPPNEREKECIYKSQVLIPVLVSGICHAMLGPLPNPDIKPDLLKDFFPTYFHTKPIGAGVKPQPQKKTVEQNDPQSSTDDGELSLTYLNYTRIFRTCPWSKDPSDYLSWLDKVEKIKGDFWKEVGIFDLIQLSRAGPNICPNMLLTSLYFWDSTYNTFHLPCGMVTPTLFDAVAIVGLRPNGIDFNPTNLNEDTIAFDTSFAPYSLFMSHYHDKDTTEVSDVEHIAFLTLWLSKYVFCPRSLQVAKRFITMANQLHAGTKLCLSEMILANLYEFLSESVNLLKTIKDQGKIHLSGPFWLLQLWLNATFEASLPVEQEVDEEQVKDKTVEWPRLVQLTPTDEGISLRQAFKSYVMMFAKRYHFTSTMAPFASRKIGPEWFTQQLPLEMQKDENIFLDVWESFLTPRLLFSHRNTIKTQIALIVYQPNLVARQFGLIQIKPRPIFPKKGSIIFYNSLHNEEESKELSKKLTDDSLDIRPVIFRPSFLCTLEFDEWWKDYYSTRFFDVTTFTTHLTNAFAFVQDRTKKAVKIPTKKTSVEASPSAAKKPSTKVSRKAPPVQKRTKEEEKEEKRVSNEESGDESLEPNPPPPQKKKIKKVSSQRSIVKSANKDSPSTPIAKLQSKDTESGKSSLNTEIPETQLDVEGNPEKTLEKTVQEEDVPKNDHDRQTVAEFDAPASEASEDDSPPHPGLNVANKGDDTDMETEVEDDHEEETAKDKDDQSKQQDGGQILGRSTQPAPDQTKGSAISTGSTGFSREELESLKVQKPLEYLKAMLSARFNFQDSSQSSSTTSGTTSEAPSLANVLTKIKTKILDVDLFKVLEENALAHIKLKKILKQINVLETSVEVGNLHRQRDLSQQISTKSETQAAEWDAVATSTDKVSKLQQLSETYIKEVAACDDNIQKWEKQITALQEKISQEKKRRASIQQPKQNEIDDELKSN